MAKKTIAVLNLLSIFYTTSGYGAAHELFLHRSKSELSAAQQNVIIIVATNTQIPFLYFKDVEKKIATIFSHLNHIKKSQPREEERFFNFFKHLLAARPNEALPADIIDFAQQFGLTQSPHNAFFLIKSNGKITEMAYSCVQVILTELVEEFYCHFTIDELKKMRKIKIQKSANHHGKKE